MNVSQVNNQIVGLGEYCVPFQADVEMLIILW